MKHTVQSIAILAVTLAWFVHTARGQNPSSNQATSALIDYGEPNPDAPEQLAVFDFLVGKWSCEVTVRHEDGTISRLEAEWTGRYILDGYVIVDEYRMTDVAGKLVMSGMNYRAYDTEADAWNMKWLEGISGSWLDLAPRELGGVKVDDSTIEFKVDYKAGEIHRIAFEDITDNSFTWTVDISNDGGKSWNQSVTTIRATRVDGP